MSYRQISLPKFFFEKYHLNIEPWTREILAFCWILSLVLTFFVPPFQKPDESTHFYRVVSIAEGTFVCSRGENGVFKNPIPTYLKNFPEKMYERHIAADPRSPFSKLLYIETLTNDRYPLTMSNEPTSCSLPFLPYLHMAAVLAIPIKIWTNPLIVFYLGRVTNLVVGFGLFVVAVRITPKKLRIIPLLVLMLPMTLHQLGSFSKDAIHLSTGTVMLSVLLKHLHERKNSTLAFVLMFFTSLALAIFSRPYLFGLSILSFLMVPTNKLKHVKKNLLGCLIFVVVLVLFLLISLKSSVYVTRGESLGHDVSNSPISPQSQLQYLLTKPTRTLTIVGHTLQQKSVSLLGGLIGEFGWLDYQLHWYVYFIYVGIIFYVFLSKKEVFPEISWFQLFILALALGSSLFGALAAFYLYGSPVASPVILGLQGRYFILLVPLVIILFLELWKKLGVNFIRGIFLLIAFSIVFVVIRRYYRYDLHYYREYTNIEFERARNIKIDRLYSQHLPIANHKKLVGITVNPIPSKKPLSVAYVLRLYDSSCKKQLRVEVYQASTFHLNGPLDLIFKPLEKNIEGDICLELQPQRSIDESETALELLGSEANKMYLSPVYLY